MQRKKPVGLVERRQAAERHPLDVVVGTSGALAGGAGIVLTAINVALLPSPAAPAVLTLDAIVAAGGIIAASGGLAVGVSKTITGFMNTTPEQHAEISDNLEMASQIFEPEQTAADFASRLVGNLLPSYIENEVTFIESTREAFRFVADASQGKVKLDDYERLAEGIKATAEAVNRAAHEIELLRKETQETADRDNRIREQQELDWNAQRERDLKESAERSRSQIENINSRIRESASRPGSNRYDYRDNQIGSDDTFRVVA